MYQLKATRVLYQTSKYAPVAVLQLDITVPAEISSRAQISESLERIGSDGFQNLLPLSGETSAVCIYCDLALGLQQSVGHSVQYCRVQETDATLEQRVFIEYEEKASALYAAEVATGLLNGIAGQQDISQLQQVLDEFEVYSRLRVLDSNSRLLINAARRQDIPVIRPVLPRSLSKLFAATSKLNTASSSVV